MTTFEITLLVILIILIFGIGALSVPSEKGKQMHEQVKREYKQELAQKEIARVTKELLARNAA